MLSLERGRSDELRTSIAQLSRDLQAPTAARDTLTQQLASLRAETGQAARRPRRAEGRSATSCRPGWRTPTCRCRRRSRARKTRCRRSWPRRAQTRPIPQASSDGGAAGRHPRQLPAAQAQLEEMQRQIAELDQTVRWTRRPSRRALRPREDGRAGARPDGAARRAGEAGAGRGGARRPPRSSARAVVAATGGGEEAGRTPPAPRSPLLGHADRRVARAAGLGPARARRLGDRRPRTRTCRSPTSAAG